ncbi:MAG: GNAT family N-acetyltransferase [Actinomycetota bacterium]|nr:GNAT family N-acetyltransferase [Actinomycetota bacterium]
MPIELRAADPASEPGAGLLAAMVAEIASIYGEASPDDPGFGVGAAELSPPTGAFLVGWEDGAAVACGGVKRWDDETGEIKRMYVAPAARSRGHARVLLAGLEAAARDLGYTRVRLDTGPEQPHARALYESEGYADIADYNGNRRAAFWFEKAL